jgi:hypothetical protein
MMRFMATLAMSVLPKRLLGADVLVLYWVLPLSTPVDESPLTLTDYMADIPIQVSEYVFIACNP